MKKALALIPVVALIATAAPATAQQPGLCPTPTAGCPAPAVSTAQPPAVINMPKPKALKKKKKRKAAASGAVVRISPW